MSSAHIAIGYSQGRGVGGAQLPVRKSLLSRSENINSSGTSAASNLAATAAEVNDGALWFITAVGADILVTCGPGTPVAAVANAHRIPVGQTLELAISTAGEKVAVIDA